MWLQDVAGLAPQELALLAQLNPEGFAELAALVNREQWLRERRQVFDLYPETGILSRHGYPKHLEFFEAGSQHNERAFIAGNRVGKTMAVCYEAVCHLIGWYPAWWCGRRFARPVVGWAAGEDAKAVRESLQPTLFGPGDARGTGLIPAESLRRARVRSGIPDALDFAEIKHSSGGVSRLVIKAYEQGRKSFQGAKIDFAILDEEPPLAIYSETKTRTMATKPGETNGLIMCSFTPLKGISETVLYYLPGGAFPETEELRLAAWGW